MSSDFKTEDPEVSQAVLRRVGHLIRQLREGLRELGLDRQVELAASAIPDSRDRLNYVAQLAEQAAKRVLDAIDVAHPEAKELMTGSRRLREELAAWVAEPQPLTPGSPLMRMLIAFFQTAPERLAVIKAQHTEITLAQDFQDLTGQVIKRTLDIIGQVETELLQVLVDHAPRAGAPEPVASLQNGPQIKTGQPNAFGSQAAVDEFLGSIDF